MSKPYREIECETLGAMEDRKTVNVWSSQIRQDKCPNGTHLKYGQLPLLARIKWSGNRPKPIRDKIREHKREIHVRKAESSEQEKYKYFLPLAPCSPASN